MNRDTEAKKVILSELELRGFAFSAPTPLVDVPEHVAGVRQDVAGPRRGKLPVRQGGEVTARADDTEVGPAELRLDPRQAANVVGCRTIGHRHPRHEQCAAHRLLRCDGQYKAARAGRECAHFRLQQFEEQHYLLIGL